MSTRKPPETFDPREWEHRVGSSFIDRYGNWGTRDIIGPRDACSVVAARKELRPYVAFGPPTPVDVFLLSIGEPEDRAATKIGGVPFWPRRREWPRSQLGKPLPFLAQFCFCESTDIVGDLPGDLLLLFGEGDLPGSIIARWQSYTPCERLIDGAEMPVKARSTCFHGVRWRTESFLEAEYDDNPICLPNGTRVSDLWFVCELLGMQIGPRPFFPRWNDSPRTTDRAICSMCSVLPTPEALYPFVNRSEPLTDQESLESCVGLSDIGDADGFGVVCVTVGADGEAVVHSDNL